MIEIVLPGEPIAQIRMRVSSINGMSRVYDPRAKQKKAIKEILAAKYTQEKIEHPYVSFVFHCKIPSSTPKKIATFYRENLIKNEKKPDVDNYVKLYLDCMDQIFFDGDQKVMIGPCLKLYSHDPKTCIYIKESSEALTVEEVGPLLSPYLFS